MIEIDDFDMPLLKCCDKCNEVFDEKELNEQNLCIKCDRIEDN